jgi:hypothetical protein
MTPHRSVGRGECQGVGDGCDDGECSIAIRDTATRKITVRLAPKDHWGYLPPVSVLTVLLAGDIFCRHCVSGPVSVPI